MKSEPRVFQDFAASEVKGKMPVCVGITGPQHSGKTYSAMRIAEGMKRVVGGEIYYIDSERGRSLHYRDKFNFRYVQFDPPYNAESYLAAIEHCEAKGATVIVIDSMSHEHSGEGGLLDQIEDYLQKRAGDDDNRREKLKWAAQIEPKAERNRLNRHVTGSTTFFILCYRAKDKTKPGAGGKAVHIGWQAETSSTLPYEMTVRFLLPPGSDGHPNLEPDTEWEKLEVKNPSQFRDWFKPGFQLNEEVGERLARWSIGDAGPSTGDLLKAIGAELDRLAPKVDGPAGAEAARARKDLLVETIGTSVEKEIKALGVDALSTGLGVLKSKTNVVEQKGGEQ
jgi:hypothetical protein